MSRNLLHKTKLEPFKAWLDSQRIAHRPPRGENEVLQVEVPAYCWACVFDRHDATEHFTVDRRIEPIVRRFIRETRPA